MNIQESTLVFKLGQDNNFSDLDITTDIQYFIADLRGVSLEVANSIKDKFLIFDKNIYNSKGSFVIVCDFSFDDDLTIVPTMQEAYDYVEMVEIEKQLES